ncbi:MAG: hypothetical protein US51_C0025G0005 [Microgenomates group bacterium GW2011_GWA2_37_6]|nr:MAG: hypothetical protein US51_C0025G0005 [Microgenomates group bacterium GW2011_GWA2_37_6]
MSLGEVPRPGRIEGGLYVPNNRLDPEGSFFDSEPGSTIAQELQRGIGSAFRREFIESVFQLMKPQQPIEDLPPVKKV